MKLHLSGISRVILIAGALVLLPVLVSAAPHASLIAKPAKSGTANSDYSGDSGVGQRLGRQLPNADGAAASVATQATSPDAVLVALGTLGAANLYYSYLTLGTVADGYVSGTYDGRIAISVANEAIFMNGNARAGLATLIDSPSIAREDRDVLVVMVQTYDVLNNQAKALIQFISDQKDDGSEYQKYRTEAWKRIVELFGIKQ